MLAIPPARHSYSGGIHADRQLTVEHLTLSTRPVADGSAGRATKANSPTVLEGVHVPDKVDGGPDGLSRGRRSNPEDLPTF